MKEKLKLVWKTLFTIVVLTATIVAVTWTCNWITTTIKEARIENQILWRSAQNWFSFYHKNISGKEVDFTPVDKITVDTCGREYEKYLKLFGVASIHKIGIYIGYPSPEGFTAFSHAFAKDGNMYFRDAGEITKSINHELVHAFVFWTIENNGSSVPSWFNEGLAEIYGKPDKEYFFMKYFFDENDRYMTARKKTDPQEFFKLSGYEEIKKNTEAGGSFYSISMQLVELLIKKEGGEEKLKQFLKEMESGKSFNASMRSIYKMSPVDLWNKWINDNG